MVCVFCVCICSLVCVNYFFEFVLSLECRLVMNFILFKRPFFHYLRASTCNSFFLIMWMTFLPWLNWYFKSNRGIFSVLFCFVFQRSHWGKERRDENRRKPTVLFAADTIFNAFWWVLTDNLLLGGRNEVNFETILTL